MGKTVGRRYCSYAVCNPNNKKKTQVKEPVSLEWGKEFQALRRDWKKARGKAREQIWFRAFDLHCERRCAGKWGQSQNKCEIEAEKEIDAFFKSE